MQGGSWTLSWPRPVGLGIALAAALALLGGPLGADAAQKIQRPPEPVVIDGAQVEALLGRSPSRIVAFRVGRSEWRQIPVQVDERRTVDLGDVYNGTRDGLEIETYADPGTLAGPDPDPKLDPDDEIALMARNAGARAERGMRRPEGTRGDAVRLRIRDPRDGAKRWVYLFHSRLGRLEPSAGRDLVYYELRLRSGAYPGTYRLNDGPNPETSKVITSRYELGFSDRWINDRLEIRAEGADTFDILDRRKAQFSPGFCGRSTDTFSDAEGAYVVSRDGPVRAIRSYVGANSGPMTQREHVYYDGKEVVATYLRVHAIPGVIDFIDYAPTPGQMVYRSNTSGEDFPVDGVPDAVPAASPAWEQVSGPHGTVTHLLDLDTSAPDLELASFHLDQDSPELAAETQCTGDGVARASSGVAISGGIPNTDPLRGGHEDLTGLRVIYYDGPEHGRTGAEEQAAWAQEPLRTVARTVSVGR